MFGLDAGALEPKRAAFRSIFGSNGEQSKKVAATSRRHNVATSQRRDVGSTNTEVNNLKRRDASTSRRLNVATSARDLHLII